ncbi:MAG TPA: hypothetical protein VE954_43290 [Oligoflexus sp.]|uniref:hypothetical protein n=1 Tax=Oligoflexus sp. TaxID=1971216 RepID=UPI002D3D4519|nr:hypothetical protein [Oligoflexus sp.]HYX39970.1 hypothetical protein [Oligoflexus sp.]
MSQTIEEGVKEQLQISMQKVELRVGEMPAEFRAMVMGCMESDDLLMMSVLGLTLEVCLVANSYEALSDFKRWLLQERVKWDRYRSQIEPEEQP